jgi:hypothetical protein
VTLLLSSYRADIAGAGKLTFSSYIPTNATIDHHRQAITPLSGIADKQHILLFRRVIPLPAVAQQNYVCSSADLVVVKYVTRHEYCSALIIISEKLNKVVEMSRQLEAVKAAKLKMAIKASKDAQDLKDLEVAKVDKENLAANVEIAVMKEKDAGVGKEKK